MNLRQIKETIISKLFIVYLELVFKTSDIVLNELNFDINNSIIGFWHGDSYSMNLVIKKLVSEKFSCYSGYERKLYRKRPEKI